MQIKNIWILNSVRFVNIIELQHLTIKNIYILHEKRIAIDCVWLHTVVQTVVTKDHESYVTSVEVDNITGKSFHVYEVSTAKYG